MLKEAKRFTIQLIAGCNLATIIMMLCIGFSDRLSPQKYTLLSNLGLLFPLILAINLGFLVFWLLTKKKVAWLPIVGFIVCYIPIHTYLPINLPKTVTPDALKIMSYNVWSFAGWERHPDGRFPILDYICKEKADILCLQEAMTHEIGQARVDKALDKVYPYKDTLRVSMASDCIAVYSKYPIVSHERIRYPSRGNISGAFEIKIGNDTIIVINNHFETTGLNGEDKEQFKLMLKGNLKSPQVKQTSYRLIDKLGEASAKRAVEVDAVSRYIMQHKDKSMIVCGDFNDGPISYAHHTINKDLIDCYAATGNGIGISYHKSGMYVRIDHIFCSKDWQPLKCYVDNNITTSDHYPIICWLKKRGKP